MRDVAAAHGEISSWPDEQVLRELRLRTAPLPAEESEAVTLLLNQATRRGLELDARSLRGWARRRGTAHAAVRAAATSTDPGVPALLRPLLDDPRDATVAAAALCRLRDTASTARVVEVLASLLTPAPQVHDAVRVAAALDLMGDRSAAPPLLAMTADAPDRVLDDLVRTVRRLTHHAPLPDPGPDGVRSAWARVDLGAEPSPAVVVTVQDDVDAWLEVSDGRDDIALEDLDAGPASAWATWSVAWTQGGRDLYRVGSSCGTCEVLLEHVGWAPEEAVALAQEVRGAVADVSRLTPALLDALAPVLTGCATGRYHLRLRDTRLHHGLADHEHEDLVDRPEQVHGARDETGRPLPVWVAPTQPGSRLDEGTVRAFEAQIAAGRRPAVLVAAHATARTPWGGSGEAEEVSRRLTGFVIDGHHKLAAYQRLGLPARVLWLCDLSPRIDPGTTDPEELYSLLLDPPGAGSSST